MKISASILSADFANLSKAVIELTNSGVDYIHIDVMDGIFVPCISIGSQVVKSLRKCTTVPLDVHLMVKNPETQIGHFAAAGADMITMHIETVVHTYRAISLVKSYGKKVGISLVPSTHPSSIEYILDTIDLVLIMSVNPGFGGQKFIPSQLKKIETIKSMIKYSKSSALIAVDGGIEIENAQDIKDAGADILVIGSAMFTNGNYSDNINEFRKILL